MHKGFKCLDVAAGRVYISRDVVFYESVYPFSILNPNAGVRLRSEILLLPNHIQPNNLPTPGVELIDCSNINAPIIPVTVNAPLSSGQTAKISTSNDEATLGVRRTWSCADQIVCADQITATGGPATQSCADQIVYGSSLTRVLVPDFSRPAWSVPALSSAIDATAASTAVSPSVSSVPLPAAPVCPSTRLQHGIRKPKVYTVGTIHYVFLLLLVSRIILMRHWVTHGGSLQWIRNIMLFSKIILGTWLRGNRG
jgi:hypothetical protein